MHFAGSGYHTLCGANAFDASLSGLPGSVDGLGYPAFVATLAALVLTQGCGHALGKTARISFVFAAASLSGLAVPVMRETRDRVNCPECAKLYCAVKNAPWNEVDTDILTRAAYMAPAL